MYLLPFNYFFTKSNLNCFQLFVIKRCCTEYLYTGVNVFINKISTSRINGSKKLKLVFQNCPPFTFLPTMGPIPLNPHVMPTNDDKKDYCNKGLGGSDVV